jgi:CBS domain-containing protein
MRNLLVADIMTREPITIIPEMNLLECSRKMVRKKVGSLLLVKDKKLVGIISRKDILWALIKKSKEDLKNIKAIDIAPRKIATTKPTTPVKEAFEKMRNIKFERLPVINNNELVGMVTVRDILNFHPELYPELEEFSSIREETEKIKKIKKVQTGIEGMCEECGNNELLFRVNGMLLCENCQEAI